MRDKGVDILVGNSRMANEIIEELPKSSLSFLDNSEIKREWMYNIYWEPQLEECLFLPWDGMSVPQALDRLIAEGMTADLMCKQINEVIDDINKWNNMSISSLRVYWKHEWRNTFCSSWSVNLSWLYQDRWINQYVCSQVNYLRIWEVWTYTNNISIFKIIWEDSFCIWMDTKYSACISFAKSIEYRSCKDIIPMNAFK